LRQFGYGGNKTYLKRTQTRDAVTLFALMRDTARDSFVSWDEELKHLVQAGK